MENMKIKDQKHLVNESIDELITTFKSPLSSTLKSESSSRIKQEQHSEDESSKRRKKPKK